MARALDLGITAWSPLAGGLLTGKYAQREKTLQAPRRLDLQQDLDRRSARQDHIIQVLTSIAQESNVLPAQVALAWLLKRGIIPILGARTLPQLQQNLGSLNVTLSDQDFQHLNDASRIELGFPHEYLIQPMANATMYGGMFNQLTFPRTNELPEGLQQMIDN